MTRSIVAKALVASCVVWTSVAAAISTQAPMRADRAATAPSAVPLTRKSAITLFERFDTTLNKLEQTTEGWQAIPSWPRDFRKATVASDIGKYVLPETVKSTLAQQRREAQQQFNGGDWPGAIIAINTAYTTLTDTIKMFGAVVSYWRNRPSYDARIASWENLLKVNHLDDTRSEELRALLTTLNDDASQGKFLDIVQHDYPALDSAYETAIRNARYYAGRTLIDDPLRRAGATACQDASAGAADPPNMQVQIRPQIDVKRTQPTDNFYPPYARILGAEGVTTLRALVARSGCLRWVEVTRSSGVVVLDEAALEWASKGAVFDPAVADGQPVELAVQFNVRFKLTP